MRSVWILISFFTLSGCLSGGGGPVVDLNTGGSDNLAAEAITTVNSQLNAVNDMIDGNSSAAISLAPGQISSRVAFGGQWTLADGVPSLTVNGDYMTLQQWMMGEFDENTANEEGAKTTFSGRIANTLDVFCYMAYAGISLDSSTNLPTPGGHTLTVNQSMVDNCGAEAQLIGASISLTSEALSGSDNFDTSLSFELPGSENCPFRMLVKVNGTETNVATSEDQTCSGRDQASASLFMYNSSTQITRFWYISKNFSEYPAGFEVYRGYLNEATDEAYVGGYYGSDQDGAPGNLGGITFSAVGKPTAGGSVAVGMHITQANTVTPGTYQACVDPGNMSVSTDDSLACTMTGTGADTVFTNVVQAEFSLYSSLNSIYNIDGNTDFNFTDNTDIF